MFNDTCFIGGKYLEDIWFRTRSLSGVDVVHDLVVVGVDGVETGVVAVLAARWVWV